MEENRHIEAINNPHIVLVRDLGYSNWDTFDINYDNPSLDLSHLMVQYRDEQGELKSYLYKVQEHEAEDLYFKSQEPEFARDVAEWCLSEEMSKSDFCFEEIPNHNVYLAATKDGQFFETQDIFQMYDFVKEHENDLKFGTVDVRAGFDQDIGEYEIKTLREPCQDSKEYMEILKKAVQPGFDRNNPDFTKIEGEERTITIPRDR